MVYLFIPFLLYLSCRKAWKQMNNFYDIVNAVEMINYDGFPLPLLFQNLQKNSYCFDE